MRDQDGEHKSFGEMIKEALEQAAPYSDSELVMMFNDDLPDTPPWIGPGAGMGHQGGEFDYMPHASESLLEVGDLLPPPPPLRPTDLQQAEGEDPTPMSEEEWLRELARRMNNHAVRFGAVDKKIRREMELAARMLNGYAHLWELRNREEKENE